MTTILIRTVLIYFILLIAMRMMGKRQIGELEISDLITTLLISEIASLPLTDEEIPLSHAVIPMITLMTFEVVSSTLVANVPRIKNLITARPATLIKDGKPCAKELRKARISADELISELRQKEITDLSQVRYAILEQNGKISVISRASAKPPTAEQVKLKVEDEGIFHVTVDKGVLNKHALKELKLSEAELQKQLSALGLTPKDIYVMLISDRGSVRIITKGEADRQS